MGRVGHRHPRLTALRLHGRDVEHKVRLLDAAPRRAAPDDAAVLAEGVAHAADLQVVLGHGHLPAQRVRLTGNLHSSQQEDQEPVPQCPNNNLTRQRPTLSQKYNLTRPSPTLSQK